MNKEPTVTTQESGHLTQTNVLYIDNLLAASERIPHGEPLTFGATPLDRIRTLKQQLDLGVSLQAFTMNGLPDDVPLPTIDYVHRTFMKRFHGRSEANEENYMTALHTKEEFTDDPTLLAMIDRGELGHASPTELLIIRQLLGIRSVELACLTHPYGGDRIKMLPTMREAVREHVEMFGGNYCDEPETRYRVKEVIGLDEGDDSFRNGLLMTRKRTLATLYDGTVIRERSSFVLRTDENSLLTADDIDALKSVDLKSPTHEDQLVTAAHLDEMVSMLLDMDEHSLAIPIATTIYAFNPETAEKIRERDQALLEARRAEFMKQYPMIAAAMNGARAHAATTPDKVFEIEDGGILYVGPKQQ